MPRQAKPWYRSQTDTWYVEVHGRQHLLGKHPPDAPVAKRSRAGWNTPPSIVVAFHKKMAESPDIPKAQAALVCQICDLFLIHCEKHNEARTFQ